MFLTTTVLGQSGPEDPIIANPNRPTVTDPADITQFGVAEIEYGFSAAKSNQSFDGLLKFAFARNFELRIGSNTMFHDSDHHKMGVGDTTVGVQWRIVRQKKAVPTIALAYLTKVPTAPVTFGSGKFDHEIKALFSKDFGKWHVDTNLGYVFLKRPDSAGYDHLFIPTLAFSHPVKGKWGATAEIWGVTHQNANIRGTTSLLAAATYQMRPRLVFDSGMNFGIRGDEAPATFFIGVTYSIFDLYHPSRR
ncbi:MAG: hypothetical protein JWN45_600 [Acidobacteriaceae bacterium]|nr:hypothetical protein [Acidobacteriaceae bacterium]